MLVKSRAVPSLEAKTVLRFLPLEMSYMLTDGLTPRSPMASRCLSGETAMAVMTSPFSDKGINLSFPLWEITTFDLNERI